jgi:hypothetical protein
VRGACCPLPYDAYRRTRGREPEDGGHDCREDRRARGAEALTAPRAIYFSFVTQATLGYGDIVPVGDHAQGVVVAQGMGGQMYLAVLIARLVSLYAAQGNR